MGVAFNGAMRPDFFHAQMSVSVLQSLFVAHGLMDQMYPNVWCGLWKVLSA